MEDVETALAIDARSPEALLERGILRFEKGDLAGAHKAFIQVRLLAPDSAAAVSAGKYIEPIDVQQSPPRTAFYSTPPLFVPRGLGPPDPLKMGWADTVRA